MLAPIPPRPTKKPKTASVDMKNIEELKSTGLKATLPRLKILEIFQNGVQRHMSAEDVYRILLGQHSDIGLATVYRVLTQFEQAGLLIRGNFDGGKAVYELNEGQHRSFTTRKSKNASAWWRKPRAGSFASTPCPCTGNAPVAPRKAGPATAAPQRSAINLF